MSNVQVVLKPEVMFILITTDRTRILKRWQDPGINIEF
jgi:hypothetical protein